MSRTGPHQRGHWVWDDQHGEVWCDEPDRGGVVTGHTCGIRLPEGGKAAHCPTCCRTFTTPANFDRHRRGPADARVCLDPAEIGLVEVRRKGYTAWSMPGREDSP